MIEAHRGWADGERAALEAIERSLRADDPALASAFDRFAPRSRGEVVRSLLWTALLGAGAAFAWLGQMSTSYAALQRSVPPALHAAG